MNNKNYIFIIYFIFIQFIIFFLNEKKFYIKFLYIYFDSKKNYYIFSYFHNYLKFLHDIE